MSDLSVAEIARRLVIAMLTRARTRLPEDMRVVQHLQVELVNEVAAERDPIVEKGT